jgi:L-asparaginase
MKLHIITTGGTIDKIYFDAKSDYQVGEPVIGELLEKMGVGFAFTVESAMRKDSLDMTDADRALIRQLARDCQEE